MTRWTARLLMLVLLLAGCSGPGEVLRPPSPSPTPTVDPIKLINLWRVTDAQGESGQTWLRLDAGQWQLWRDTCMISGAWKAHAHLFIASGVQASGTCADDEDLPKVSWLIDVASFQPRGDGWELINSDGEVSARLTIDGRPDPIPSVSEEFTQPPKITKDVRQAMRVPKPLSDRAQPAKPKIIPGRWVPLDKNLPTEPFVKFDEDGTWEGSDGCNGLGGRWAMSDEGEFLATDGPTTMIGCDGAPLGSWLTKAGTAALQYEELILYDVNGSEIGRLTKS